MLEKHAPLQLPAAHNALIAKLIEKAGSMHTKSAEFDLARFAEQSAGVQDIAELMVKKIEAAVATRRNPEGDGETPWLTPRELHALSFSMILYPTTLLFQVVNTLQCALEHLKGGKPMSSEESVDLKEYEKIVGLEQWSEIEKRFNTEALEK